MSARRSTSRLARFRALSAALAGVWALAQVPPSAAASSARLTFWQRVRSGATTEAQLLRALERTLLGRGDDHDAMSAHSAWLDYLRGRTYHDVRIELLLARLRLETSWSYDRRLEARLGRSIERAAPSALLGQGYADWASLSALRGDAEVARVRFERALHLIWEKEPRASALLGRGWARLAQGDARGASNDFLEASGSAESLRLVVAALWSGALALERAGQGSEALRLQRRAGAVDGGRARASGRDPFDGVARLPAYEVHAVAALQFAYTAEVARGAQDHEAAAAAEVARCEALRQYLVHAEPDDAPWVRPTRESWLSCAEGDLGSSVGTPAERP